MPEIEDNKQPSHSENYRILRFSIICRICPELKNIKLKCNVKRK